LGYSSIKKVEMIIAQALTTGSPDQVGQPLDLLKIGNVFDTNQVPSSIVEQYIQWADSVIDADLNQLYVTPFCEKVDLETKLLADIDVYNNYIITSNQCPFYPGDIIVMSDTSNNLYDKVVIESIVDGDSRTTFSTNPVLFYNYSASTTRVLRVCYPDPIPLISARLAAASIYDKYFMSQSSPGQSDFGKLLRKQARVDINNILTGITILHGQRRIGRRFFNPNLAERYSLPNLNTGDANKIEGVD